MISRCQALGSASLADRSGARIRTASDVASSCFAQSGNCPGRFGVKTLLAGGSFAGNVPLLAFRIYPRRTDANKSR